MTLSEIFSKVICNEAVEVCVTPKQYASLRASLLRKFKSNAEISESVGLQDYVGKYVRCSYNSKSYTASFVMADVDCKLSKATNYSAADLADQL